MNHGFNVEIAAEYGLEQAIILEQMNFWIKKNIANGTNYHDGNYWTFNSIKAYGEMFPYMSGAAIRRVLNDLEKKGFIVTGNYNKIAYDRTKWYALTKKGFALFGSVPDEILSGEQPAGESAGENAAQSATLTQETASKTRYSKEFEVFWNEYPRKAEKAGAYKNWNARLNDGYSPDELIVAAKTYASQCHQNHTETRFIKLAKTFIGPSMPFLDMLPQREIAQQTTSQSTESDDVLVNNFGNFLARTGA